ncbi:MAG TPA: methylated-DNA--[protein]-cysteine S-methyltransferase [Acidimicrobiales bacterium]
MTTEIAAQHDHLSDGVRPGLRFVPAPPASDLRSTVVTTPIGDVVLIGANDVLVELELPGDSRVRHPEGHPGRDDAALVDAAAQLSEYFSGTRRSFDLAVAPQGTEFQTTVWATLAEIPYGTTATYGEVAAKVGNAKASRAVGMANNRNPIALIIPCHRVIGASGKLVGYGGGLPAKEFLLNLERGAPR